MMKNSHPGPRELLHTYEGVFQEDFTDGLPPVMSVDYIIEVLNN